MLESLLNKITDPKTCNLIKKRLQHRLFPVNIVKVLRAAFLQNTSGGCFLSFIMNICYFKFQINKRYFLIRFAQTKITLFIFVNNWVIKENESFLLVEPCSRVTCCVEIQLKYFFRKYIFICTIYTLLMQLISAILYDMC